MRFSLWPSALAAVLFAATSSINVVNAKSCVVFDANFNLYAFGLSDGSDYALGASDSWKSGSAKKLTGDGRPPFNGKNTQCFLAQFFNAIYVIDGDSSNPSHVHIFDAGSQSWSTQNTNLNGVDPTSAVAILDHDTNVFFAMSGGTLYSADFAQLKSAQGGAIDWQNVGKPPFKTDGYNPVMAIAQNHIHFLNVPDTPAGQAYIFVIHFNFFQPTPQGYAGQNTFPDSHGQAPSFFTSQDVQQQFAFIPDDGSNTYIVNVENNSTTTLAGPSNKDSSASYGTSTNSLVQLTSSGAFSFLAFNPGNPLSSNTWSAITLSGLPAPTSGSPGSTSQSGSATASGTRTGTPSGTTSSTGSASGTRSPTGASASATPTGGAMSSSRASLAGYALAIVAVAFTVAL